MNQESIKISDLKKRKKLRKLGMLNHDFETVNHFISRDGKITVLPISNYIPHLSSFVPFSAADFE